MVEELIWVWSLGQCVDQRSVRKCPPFLPPHLFSVLPFPSLHWINHYIRHICPLFVVLQLVIKSCFFFCVKKKKKVWRGEKKIYHLVVLRMWYWRQARKINHLNVCYFMWLALNASEGFRDRFCLMLAYKSFQSIHCCRMVVVDTQKLPSKVIFE